MTNARTLYDNGFLRVTGSCVNGRELVTIDRVATQTGCIVVPVTSEGKVVLIREFRHGAGCEVVGVVKGASDSPDEPIQLTASRELLEELGLSATDIVVSQMTLYALPALTATRGKVVFAYGCTRVAAPELEANESVSVYDEVDALQLYSLLRSGAINDAESVAALQAYLLEPGVLGGLSTRVASDTMQPTIPPGTLEPGP